MIPICHYASQATQTCRIWEQSTVSDPKIFCRFSLRGNSNFPRFLNFFIWSIYWGVRLKCYYAFFLVCCGCDTSYIVSIHIQCQAFMCTLSLCRGHSWRVRLAKQETLTPPGHLVSPLVCRGPWMSTVVLYCWCHSDSASVLLYFTYISA